MFQFKYKMVIDGIDNYYTGDNSTSSGDDDGDYIRISIVKLVLAFVGAFIGVILLGMLCTYLMAKIMDRILLYQYQGRNNQVRDYDNDFSSKKKFKSTPREDDYSTSRKM
mmetsp:Transcript_25181/g.24637  ORF Transcript_25181/g.24637 Transcript_25181/m.24637 type:complete len:110 (-) Transcript_25181:135-464(-)